MTNDEFAIAIKSRVAKAHKAADEWMVTQIERDDEGIDPDFEDYCDVAVEHFCEDIHDLVSEEVEEDENFEAVAEEIVCEDLDYCYYVDCCKDIRDELWEDWMRTHNPEALYGVSSEFTIPRRR